MSINEDSKAVSESLGYIMIFGVVIACIAIMFVVGNQLIASNQESTSFQNMEQNFNIIQSNLRNSASGSSPVTTTTLNVHRGSLSLLPADESNSRIVIRFSGYPDIDIPLGILKYISSSGSSIALENGASISAYTWDAANDSLMIQQPRLFYSNTTGTLMICTVDLKGQKSSISSSFVQLKLMSGELPSPASYPTGDPDGEAVQVCIMTNFSNAWKNYLIEVPGLRGNIDGSSPPNWANVTLSDEHNPGNGIKNLIVVRYEVGAGLG